MKIHIPNELYRLAKQKQRLYSSKGVNKPMIDCAAEVYMEKDGLVPDLKSIEYELKKLSSHFEKDSFSHRKGGWMQ